MVHIDPGRRLLLCADWRLRITPSGKPGLFDPVQKKLVPVVLRRIARHDKLFSVQARRDVISLAAVARAVVF